MNLRIRRPGGMNELFARTYAVRRPTVLFVMTLACVGAAGCGFTKEQVAAIHRFSAATTEVAELSGKAFQETRRDVIDLRTGMVELGSASVDLENSAMDLDGPLDADQLEKRLRAVQALGQFAVLLDSLNSDEHAGRLLAATESIVTNLRSVEGVDLSDKHAEAITAIVKEIGGWWIAWKQKSATRTTVLETNASIKKLLQLVGDDFDPEKLRWAAVLTQTEDSIRGTLIREIGLLRPDDERVLGMLGNVKLTATDIALLKSDANRLGIEAKKKLDRLKVTSAALTKAIGKLSTAHAELVNIVQHADHDMGNFNAFLSEAQGLVNHVKVVLNE